MSFRQAVLVLVVVAFLAVLLGLVTAYAIAS
jgi:hypothetical protein